MNFGEYGVERSVGHFMYRVYGWMCAGLALTALVAYYVSTIPGLALKINTNMWILMGLFIAQIGLVVALSALINRMNYMTAVTCFLFYAALMGATLSGIFLIYDIVSIYLTFAVTAGMFGVMALYGYFTRSDLSTIGNICTMALFGLIIAMLVNMYFKSQTMDYILSIIGVVVFTLLTAYDVQKIKQMASQLAGDEPTLAKVAIIGALTLYLDFINLFLFLLRFFGRRRD